MSIIGNTLVINTSTSRKINVLTTKYKVTCLSIETHFLYFLDFHPSHDVLIACILLAATFIFIRSLGNACAQESAICSKDTRH